MGNKRIDDYKKYMDFCWPFWWPCGCGGTKRGALSDEAHPGPRAAPPSSNMSIGLGNQLNNSSIWLHDRAKTNTNTKTHTHKQQMRRPREDRPNHAKTTNSDDAWTGFAQNDAGHSMFQSSPSAFFIFTSAIINYHSAQGSIKIKRKIEIIQPSRPEMSKYKLARVYQFI